MTIHMHDQRQCGRDKQFYQLGADDRLSVCGAELFSEINTKVGEADP